ncbi:MAG: hypothetical protein ACT4PT_04340 [Methanobacteriota archaeon]
MPLLAVAVLAPALAGCLGSAPVTPTSLPGDRIALPEGFMGAIPVVVDQPVFWVGPVMRPTSHLTADGQRDMSACDHPQRGGCPEFVLDVGPRGARLRVGLDHPSTVVANWFSIELRGPRGTVLAYTGVGPPALSGEVFVEAPAAGQYLVRVRPWDVPEPADPPFALRVKLEAALPEPPSDGVLLPPNLRVEPPSAFTFLLPPPLYQEGVPELVRETLSCLPDEMAEEGAKMP